jgi:DNA-binding response OmpR family regulator
LRELGVSRVLFMSGYADQPEFTSQIESGAVSFLAKPFAPHELAARVRAVLDEGDGGV